MNEQGVQWDFNILAHGSATVFQLEVEIERELDSHDTERDDELHRARVHMQFVCRMHQLQHDEGRYFLHEHCQSCHGGKIASKEFRR